MAHITVLDGFVTNIFLVPAQAPIFAIFVSAYCWNKHFTLRILRQICLNSQAYYEKTQQFPLKVRLTH